MTEARANGYLAECFWPGVAPSDLRLLDERAAAAVDALARAGESIRYLGSLLMRTDEVVLCLFQGSETSVRKAAEQADIPFERILQADRSPWSTPDTT